MKKSRVAFRNFANAPKSQEEFYSKLRHVFIQVKKPQHFFFLPQRRRLDEELRDIGELEQLLICTIKVNSDGHCLAQQLYLFNTVFYCYMFRLISIHIFIQFLSQYKRQFIICSATSITYVQALWRLQLVLCLTVFDNVMGMY